MVPEFDANNFPLGAGAATTDPAAGHGWRRRAKGRLSRKMPWGGVRSSVPLDKLDIYGHVHFIAGVGTPNAALKLCQWQR